MRFVKETRIAASAEAVFAFHERPDALALLQPPWQAAEIVQPPSSLAVGTRVVLRVRFGPFRRTIDAEHVAYEPGRMFADRMVRGPFASWLHRHVVTPIGPAESLLTDDVEYELPFGAVGRLLGARLAERELERLFEYRHAVTRRECERRTDDDRGGAARDAGPPPAI
ncbi:MAG TPA: SRPBCC family protein [Candidatus Binatia bacterium]|nr:SRPBCC family protein [Candidatus Binatia bacterium]